MLRYNVPLAEQLDWAYRGLRPEFRKVLQRTDFRDFDELAQKGRRWETTWASAKEYRPPPPPESSFLPEFAFRPETASAAHKRTPDSAVTEIETPPKSSGEPSLGNRNAIDRREGSEGKSRDNGHQSRFVGEKISRGKEHKGKRNFKDGREDSKVRGGQRRLSTSAEKAPKDSMTDKEVICFRCQKPGHFQIGCALPRKIACYRCKTEGYTIKNCPNCSGNGEKKQ